MKKGQSIKFFLVLVLLTNVILINTSLISAQYSSSNPEEIMREIISQTTDFLRPVFEFLVGEYSGSDSFLVKSLLLIMLFIIISAVLRKTRFGDTNNSITMVIALIVSVLSIRFMPEDYVTSILLPYTTLGIALSTIIPFMVIFYFVYATQMGGVGRRFVWGLFAVVFVTLFITRRATLSDLGQKIYIAVMVLIVLALIFDTGIKRYFFAHELNVFYAGAKNKAVARLQAEYLEIINVDTPEAKRRKHDIEDNLKRIGGSIP